MTEEIQESSTTAIDGNAINQMHKAKRQSELFFFPTKNLDNSKKTKTIVEFYFADANLPYDK